MYLIEVFRYKNRNQMVKLVLNTGLQKGGLCKEEEIRLCSCSCNNGKVVGVTGFKAFRGKLKTKKYFQNSRFQSVKAKVK